MQQQQKMSVEIQNCGLLPTNLVSDSHACDSESELGIPERVGTNLRESIATIAQLEDQCSRGPTVPNIKGIVQVFGSSKANGRRRNDMGAKRVAPS